MKLHKSILAAALGLALAVGFGIGATELHASVQALDSASDNICPAVCPVGTQKSSCSVDAQI